MKICKMKKILFVLLCVTCFVSVNGQERMTVTYADNFFEGGDGNHTFQPFLEKKNRVSSKAAYFRAEFSDDMPDSIRTCVRVALDLWESKLQTSDSIALRFEMADLENDVETSVIYQRYAGKVYPLSLYQTLTLSKEQEVCAVIKINKRSVWDCSSHSAVVRHTKNMTLAMLRAVGVSLGFGSSVKEKTKRGDTFIAFADNQMYSVFDSKVVSSSGQRLTDIPNIGSRRNAALEAFAQPQDGSLYVEGNDRSYRLYAPKTFDNSASLVYLDESSSMMYYDLTEGDKVFQVDAATVDVLRSIGWNVQKKTIQIVSDELSPTGIASAYQPHTFRLNATNHSALSDVRWSFSLRTKAGRDTIIASVQNQTEFCISAIENETLYERNVNGDLYGLVEVSAWVDGELMKDAYRVSLELKPKVLSSVVTSRQCSASGDTYEMDITVGYVGSDVLLTTVEEENSSTQISQYVYEPFQAHCHFSDLSSESYLWIDLSVENDYGVDVKTLEFGPLNERSNRKQQRKGVMRARVDLNQTTWAVFSSQGALLPSVKSTEDLKQLPQGTYIIKLTDNEGNEETVKYYKR